MAPDTIIRYASGCQSSSAPLVSHKPVEERAALSGEAKDNGKGGKEVGEGGEGSTSLPRFILEAWGIV